MSFKLYTGLAVYSTLFTTEMNGVFETVQRAAPKLGKSEYSIPFQIIPRNVLTAATVTMIPTHRFYDDIVGIKRPPQKLRKVTNYTKPRKRKK